MKRILGKPHVIIGDEPASGIMNVRFELVIPCLCFSLRTSFIFSCTRLASDRMGNAVANRL